MIGNHSTSFDRWNQLSLVTGSPQEKHHALVRSVFQLLTSLLTSPHTGYESQTK
jgi:hypothetical protein